MGCEERRCGVCGLSSRLLYCTLLPLLHLGSPLRVVV